MKKNNALLLAGLCCGLIANVSAAPETKKLSSYVSTNWAVLGAPTLYATRMPTSNMMCLNTNNSTIGNSPQVGFDFSHSASSLEVSRALNLSLGLNGLQVYGITLGITPSFGTTSKNGKYTFNYTYLYSYSTQATFTPIYGNGNLSTNGAAALNAGQAAFFKTCGDSYVSNLNAGAVLAVNVSITFQTKEQADEYGLSASVGLANLASIVPAIKYTQSSISTNAIITVSATQNGGTPESLSAVLGMTPDSNGSYLSECGVSNTTACQNIINSIVAYSSNLASQVKDTNGMILPNLYYFNPVINSYATIGITVPEPKPLSASAQAAQNEIFEQVNLYENRIAFLEHYTTNSLPLSPDVKNYIANQKKRLHSRVNYINQNAANCFNANAETCPTIVAEFKTRIKAVPSAYGFDSKEYAYLNHAWQYMYNGKVTFIVPVSFKHAYATLAGGYPNKAGLLATTYSATENNIEYVSQFNIPDKDFLIFPGYNACFPAENDNKLSLGRNFTCSDGPFSLIKFNMQFNNVENPL